MQEKGIVKEKRRKRQEPLKCRKMVTKVCILGIEAIFHIFLTRIRKKLYKFAAYLKMEVKIDRNFSPKTLLTNYL